MRKVHVLAVALLLGAAAILGVVAATRTAGIGAASHLPVRKSSVAARAHRLDRVELALRRALRDRPPPLPRLPTLSRTPASPPRPAVAALAAAPRVVYRRPAPIVIIKHRSHRDDASDHESGSAGDD
jgi:hypothetical protein